MESLKEQLREELNKPSFQQQYQTLVKQTLNYDAVQQFITHHHVSDDMVRKSYAKLFEFVNECEKIKNGQLSQNAGFEPKLVLTERFIDVVYVPTAQYLAQKAQQDMSKRIKTIDMPKNIRQLSLETVDFTEDRFDVLSYLSEFSQQYPNDTTKGAYIYGSYGIGKTHLLGALAGTLAKRGVSSYLIHFPSLVVSLKSGIKENRVHSDIDVLKKSPILMLDDVGGENMTPWVRDDILMTILDYRMREQLPTFFTSNLSFELLEQHLKGSTIEDERKAMRLMERFKALCVPFQVKGANRR